MTADELARYQARRDALAALAAGQRLTFVNRKRRYVPGRTVISTCGRWLIGQGWARYVPGEPGTIEVTEAGKVATL